MVTATTGAVLDQDSLSPITSFSMGRKSCRGCSVPKTQVSSALPATATPEKAQVPTPTCLPPAQVWPPFRPRKNMGQGAWERQPFLPVSMDFEKCFQEPQQRLDLTVTLVPFLLIVWEPLRPPPSTCSPITALLSKSHQVQGPRNPDTGAGDGTGRAACLTVRPITYQGGNTGGGQTCGLRSQTVLFPNLPQQDVTAGRPGALSIACTAKSPVPGIGPGAQRAFNIL